MRRIILPSLALLLPFLSFAAVAQSAPQNCVNANGYICNGATDPNTSISEGNGSGANASYSTAIGADAVVNPGADYGTAIGAGAFVSGHYSTALGYLATASGSVSFAAGSFSTAAGQWSTAVGNYANAASNSSDAFGFGAYAGTSVPYFTGQQGVNSSGGPNYPAAGDLAVGDQATANGIGNTAIGWAASATGTNPCTDYTSTTCNPATSATAVGNMATASGLASTSLGAAAYAFGDYSTALGEGARVESGATNGTAIGRMADVQPVATNSVAIGSWSVASEADTVSVGDGASNDRRVVNMLPGINGNDAVNVSQIATLMPAFGGGASFAGGVFTPPTYVLKNPYTPGSYIGLQDTITALDQAITDAKGPAACGGQFVCNNATNGTLVVGSGASGDASNNIVIGNGAHGIPASDQYPGVDSGQVIIGEGASGTGVGNTVVGTGATATGTADTVEGTVPGHNWGMTAIGDMAHANGVAATALGAGANANSGGATAVGEYSTVAATNGTALGIGASVSAGASDSVALGDRSVADQAYTVSVGSDYFQRRITHVADGVAGTDAANVSQVQEALQSANAYTNIKAIDTLNQANAYTDWRVGMLSANIKRAVANSVAQAQMVATFAGADPNARNRVAVGTGWQGGYGAMAVGYQHVTATRNRITWNVGASISGGDGSVGAGVGFSW